MENNHVDNAEVAVKSKGSSNFISWLAPIGCIIVGELIFHLVLGAASNFNKKGPLNWMGRMFEGGFIVPILIGLFLMVLVFSIERLFTISAAQGRGSNTKFVRTVQNLLVNKDIEGALETCDRQKGAVGNVMRAGLLSYRKMINENSLTTDQKLANIQKEVEEATALEMPMLQRNLVFLSTITSLSVLVALLGTVMGMIKSFSALGSAGGAAGASELAIGISEALYNTATGIATGAFALVMYNVFTTKIDSITHSIDESGFTLTQSFASLYK